MFPEKQDDPRQERLDEIMLDYMKKNVDVVKKFE